MLIKNILRDTHTTSRYDGIASFILGLATLLLIQFYCNVTQYYFDAWSYNNLSRMVLLGRNGSGFSLYNFPTDIRGYVYPFLLLPGNFIDSISDGKISYFTAYKVYSSICYSFAFAYIIPGLFSKIYKIHISTLSRLGVLIATLFFWPGLFVYPLSDLPAVIFLMLSIYLSFKILESNQLTWKTALLSVCLGISIYSAYNIRTIYLFSVPVIFLAFAVNFQRIHKRISYYLNIVLIVIGISLAAAPQTIINQNARGSLNPMVITDGHGGDKNLFLYQLRTGITHERHETYVGTSGYSPSMAYVSKTGSAILNNTLVDWTKGMPEYGRLASRYPLDFLSIYFRHIIVGLDSRFGMIYLKNISETNNITAAMNYTLLFLAFFLLKYFYSSGNEPTSDKKTDYFRFFMIQRGNWLLALLVPVIAIIPGAMEPRFFLPLHILLYAQLFYLVPWKEVYSKARPKLVGLFLSYLLFLLILFSLSGSILINLNTFPQLLNP